LDCHRNTLSVCRLIKLHTFVGTECRYLASLVERRRQYMQSRALRKWTSWRSGSLLVLERVGNRSKRPACISTWVHLLRLMHRCHLKQASAMILECARLTLYNKSSPYFKYFAAFPAVIRSSSPRLATLPMRTGQSNQSP
jgi:hypothetical protein